VADNPEPGFSSRQFAVLRALSHLDFVSGESLARRLGCSRATVHNAIRAATHAGLPVHAIHGRGYRLGAPISWLDAARLHAGLAPRGIELRFREHLSSTNADLLAWSQAGAPHRALVCAEWQTRGRGRRGREWHIGLGGALTFSLLWRSTRPAARLSGLSLAVGVMLTRALRDLGLTRAMVKWPNDIEVDEAKLAGVLIELGGDMLGPSNVVIGIGINVFGGEQLGRRLGRPVCDLQAFLGPLDRNALLLALVERLDAGLSEFEQSGFASFREAWQACHAFQGRDVILTQGDQCPLEGRVQGVDAHGALRLATAEGSRLIHTGEISLRAAGK